VPVINIYKTGEIEKNSLYVNKQATSSRLNMMARNEMIGRRLASSSHEERRRTQVKEDR
jgi:hypothetical protein